MEMFSKASILASILASGFSCLGNPNVVTTTFPNFMFSAKEGIFFSPDQIAKPHRKKHLKDMNHKVID